MPKVIVVDLDGTLLSVNTFHKWMIFLFKKSLLKNPLDSVKILAIIAFRLIKVYNHKEMKYRILQISEATRYKKYLDEFVDELDAHLNDEVLQLIKENDVISVLATAAPSLYARRVADRYGFIHCVATPESSAQIWFENIKEKKRESLEKLLDSIEIKEVDIVLSDHHDDIPIMEMAKKVYLVNASHETRTLIRQNERLQDVQTL